MTIIMIIHHSFCHTFQLRGIPFVFRNTNYLSNEKVPLNKFLLDDDCTFVLGRCYSNNSKEELMEDEDIMTDFFGSPQKGKEILTHITKSEWDCCVE